MPSRPSLRWPVLAIVGLGLLLAACSHERRYYRPAGPLAACVEEGMLPVSEIQLSDARGRLYLGTQGIYTLALKDLGKRQKLLQIELLVVNTGEAPLAVVPERQCVHGVAGIPALRPFRAYLDGQPTDAPRIGPGETRNIDLLYRLPDSADARAVRDFLFAWEVESAQARFSDIAHFVELSREDAHFPKQTYAGIWNGFLFPGHGDIPDWGEGLFFAPIALPTPSETPRAGPENSQ